MKRELALAIEALLKMHGIHPFPSNPIEVKITSAKGDLDETVTLPLPDPEANEQWRMIKIESLSDIPTLTRNALINGGITTVGQVLNFVEEHGYRRLFNLNQFGGKGFSRLRDSLWGLGLVLGTKWRMTHRHDRDWDSHFRSE